jgi:hypothetical protein
MDVRIPTPPELREALLALAPTPAARAELAERCKVHPKTIQRFTESIPSVLEPFIEEPIMLRALLAYAERKAA